VLTSQFLTRIDLNPYFLRYLSNIKEIDIARLGWGLDARVWGW